MLIRRWMRSITDLYNNPVGRVVLLTLYYLAIIAALILMYGKGNFSTPKFIYQGF
jgi:D-Ala-teichoic acid biosynthesis protein